jgi:hypothetical protein
MNRKHIVSLVGLGVALVMCLNAAPGVGVQNPEPVQALEAPRPASTIASPLGVQFAHVSTTANIVGCNTFIRHYATDSQPNALLFVTPDVQPGGIGSYVYNAHPIGVWYSTADGRWEITNQDLFAMTASATFHVLVAAAGSNAFIHTATAGNSAGDTTYIDSALTNNNPNAMIVVTPNLSPGGGSGVNNPHYIGAWYSSGSQKWGISNLDTSAMPVGATFNVLVLPTDRPAFAHQSTAANVSGAVTYLDHPALNGHPNAIPFIFQNTSPGGVTLPADNRPTGVWYDTVQGQWAVVNLDLANMPVDVAFNVLVPSVDRAAFTHYATGTNIWTDYTYFRHSLTDNLPHTILFATANWNPGGSGGVYHNHPIGVKFAPYDAKWSVFNEDGVYMPTDPAFNVLIPVPDAGVYVHQAITGNTSGYSTYLNHPLANGRHDAVLIVTPNWNPGGGGGVYDNHAVGVWWDSAVQMWAIYNLDWVAMPTGAAFNVLVAPSGPAFGSTAFVHTATVGNTTGHITYIDHPATNNRPSALLFVTFNYNPPDSPGTGSPYLTGVYYDPSQHKWAIFNQNFAAMPVGTSFNVLVTSNKLYLPSVLRN